MSTDRVIVARDGATWRIETQSGVIFFSSPVFEHTPLAVYDFALLALTLASASHNRHFVLPYPVTRSAYESFKLYAHALPLLSPDLLSLPTVDCPHIVDNSQTSYMERSVICLSGGIDSTYAVATARPSHTLLIQGADYPVEASSGFSQLNLRVTNICKQLGCEIIVVQTNLRSFMTDWGIQHPGLLVTCLNLFSVHFQIGGYAADLRLLQDVFRYPTGNMAGVADCLTHSTLPIFHVGANKSRAEKIAHLAYNHPELLQYVSICYDSPQTSDNCGTCSKCLWTRLHLHAIRDSNLRASVEMQLFGNLIPHHEIINRQAAPDSDRDLRITIHRCLAIASTLPEGSLKTDLTERARILTLLQQTLARESKFVYELRASRIEAELRARLEEQTALNQAIYASTSWRLTWPIRVVSEFVARKAKTPKSCE